MNEEVATAPVWDRSTLRARQRATLIPMIAAAVALSFLAAWNLWFREPMPQNSSPSYELGYFIGYSSVAAIVPALVAGAVVHILARRSGDRRPLWRAFLILTGVTAAAHAILFAPIEAVRNSQLQEQRAAIEDVRGITQGFITDPTNVEVDARPKTSGKAGEVERAIRIALAATAEDAKTLKAELSELNIDPELEPARVGAASDLTGTIKKLYAAQEIIARAEQRTPRRLAETRNAINASSLSVSEKRIVIEQVDLGAEKVRPSVERLYDAQQNVLMQHIALLTILERSRGRWRYQNGGFAFEDQATLDKYRQHAAKLQAYQREFLAADAERLRVMREGVAHMTTESPSDPET